MLARPARRGDGQSIRGSGSAAVRGVPRQGQSLASGSPSWDTALLSFSLLPWVTPTGASSPGLKNYKRNVKTGPSETDQLSGFSR